MKSTILSISKSGIIVTFSYFDTCFPLSFSVVLIEKHGFVGVVVVIREKAPSFKVRDALALPTVPPLNPPYTALIGAIVFVIFILLSILILPKSFFILT